ncbi:hypothetical protein J3D54_002182 [Pseudomonas sp. GGS8]|jgi:hypothetical protein|uniref:toxin-antitoxin system TumE family protein n=1 Tax=Pseudomonas sp. GGS8 TaxID=2817892 RepID=UPI0020A227BF|nr:DUF6516 family protein [Pseudomonas sp. GGS8]MCP1443050.1 hypothetical protein [Pseudomonas sp. GGS8]
MAKPPKTTKISERSVIPEKKGNGQIRFEVVQDETGKVLTYSMAYINPRVYSGDNGRVVGYDNAHGYDHRHYMGTIEAVDFISIEDTFSRFEAEWQQYLEKRKAK